MRDDLSAPPYITDRGAAAGNGNLPSQKVRSRDCDAIGYVAASCGGAGNATRERG